MVKFIVLKNDGSSPPRNKKFLNYGEEWVFYRKEKINEIKKHTDPLVIYKGITDLELEYDLVADRFQNEGTMINRTTQEMAKLKLNAKRKIQHHFLKIKEHRKFILRSIDEMRKFEEDIKFLHMIGSLNLFDKRSIQSAINNRQKAINNFMKHQDGTSQKHNQSYETNQTPHGKLMDLQKSRNVLEDTPENRKKWLEDPSKYDLKGHDTFATKKSKRYQIALDSWLKYMKLRGFIKAKDPKSEEDSENTDSDLINPNQRDPHLHEIFFCTYDSKPFKKGMYYMIYSHSFGDGGKKTYHLAKAKHPLYFLDYVVDRRSSIEVTLDVIKNEIRLNRLTHEGTLEILRIKAYNEYSLLLTELESAISNNEKEKAKELFNSVFPKFVNEPYCFIWEYFTQSYDPSHNDPKYARRQINDVASELLKLNEKITEIPDLQRSLKRMNSKDTHEKRKAYSNLSFERIANGTRYSEDVETIHEAIYLLVNRDIPESQYDTWTRDYLTWVAKQKSSKAKELELKNLL